MQLDEAHYKTLIDRARESYNARGAHVPMILAFGSDRIAVIHFADLISDSVPRPMTYAILRHILKLLGAKSYVLISEAWRAKSIPARLCPDRIEILQVIAHFPDGRVVHTSMRVEGGKVTGEPEVFGEGKGEEMGGGMANLINEKALDEKMEALAAHFARVYRDSILRN